MRTRKRRAIFPGGFDRFSGRFALAESDRRRMDEVDPTLRTDKERCLGLRIERASDHLL